jgi:hypothetical protein
LFYIHVWIGASCGRDRFFIVTQEEHRKLALDYCATHENQKVPNGFLGKDLKPFEDQWDKLPGWNGATLPKAS